MHLLLIMKHFRVLQNTTENALMNIITIKNVKKYIKEEEQSKITHRFRKDF